MYIVLSHYSARVRMMRTLAGKYIIAGFSGRGREDLAPNMNLVLKTWHDAWGQDLVGLVSKAFLYVGLFRELTSIC